MKLDRIIVNPKRMNGQICIRNLRIIIRQLIKLLAIYSDHPELYQGLPELEEDIKQALIFSANCH